MVPLPGDEAGLVRHGNVIRIKAVAVLYAYLQSFKNMVMLRRLECVQGLRESPPLEGCLWSF